MQKLTKTCLLETSAFLFFPVPHLRHPLPEIQVCEIGRKGGGRGKGNTFSDEEQNIDFSFFFHGEILTLMYDFLTGVPVIEVQ